MSVVEFAKVRDTIAAPLNYIVDNGVLPVHYVDRPEDEHKTVKATYEEIQVDIADGRPLKHDFNVATHGFAFVDHVTGVENFLDESQIKSIYYPEIADLIKEHSGANEVFVFDHTVRFADEADREANKVRPPVRGVHNDYTENSARQRVRDMLPADEAEARLKKRFAIIQVWRAIRLPIQTDPLAICDARSLSEEALVKLTRHYPHRTAETYHIAFNPNHKWYYFPEMTKNEAIVFKVYDSGKNASTRYTAHTSFDDPTSRPDAPPRESIEMRAFAFYDED